MLKTRLIPSLLLQNGRCVKGVQFQNMRDTGHPVTAAKVYEAQGVDELVFLDIEATNEGRKALFDIVAKTADECFMPLTVGGGIKTLDDIKNILKAGADKVSINTYAVQNPRFISRAAEKFGCSTIIISIDYRQINGENKVFTNSGKKQTELDPLEWAKEMEENGAGELLVTSIDREGTGKGYDIETIRKIADSVKIPVIASGGVGNLQHLIDGVKLGHASAVSAASIFHFTDQSPIKAKAFMKEAGLLVRKI